MWSFARDDGLPPSRSFARMPLKLGTPPFAHALYCVIVALLGPWCLGSSTALNSMVTASLVLLYVSYTIPVVCLLISGRGNTRHEPLWLGNLGLSTSVVLLCWTVFTFVIYSFLPVMAVVPSSGYWIISFSLHLSQSIRTGSRANASKT